jgi:hypothetical protein
MEDFVTVATYLSLAEAEPPRLALDAAGIPTLATDESMGSLLGSNMVGGIKLQVAAADADRAKEVLASFETDFQPGTADDSDDGVSLTCPACGAEIWFPSDRRGQKETCPECGCQVDLPE